MLAFIGTQASAIFAARLDASRNSLKMLGCVAEIPRPTFVLTDPHREILYAVSEIGNAGDAIGSVFSFAIEGSDGMLRLLSQQSSGGGGPTHLVLDATGQTLFAANFGGGEVSAFPVSREGILAPACSVQVNAGSGPHRRQKNAHAHGVTLDPSQRYLLVPDMGADQIFIHRYDAVSHSISPAEAAFATPPGSGPRLILFGADGKFAYLLTELSAELYIFKWYADTGRLDLIGTSPLDAPGLQPQPSAAALAISPDGGLLYASNRTTDTIETYAIAPQSGALIHRQSVAAGGGKPWCVEISPDGRFLAVTNQASDSVQLFAMDAASGALSPVGEAMGVPMPTSIAFVPSHAH